MGAARSRAAKNLCPAPKESRVTKSQRGLTFTRSEIYRLSQRALTNSGGPLDDSPTEEPTEDKRP